MKTIEENQAMGSYYHSCVQASLTALLVMTKQFRVLTELSLEIENNEYKPDICVYAKTKLGVTHSRDIAKMTEMPLGIIEVLSPSQTIEMMFDKFELYFSAGIQSCWLILPSMKTVSVYSNLDDYQVFHSGETIEDSRLEIRLNADDIFA